MPISRPIIDAGPSISSGRAATLVMNLSNIVPPASGYRPDGEGGLVLVDQNADIEGKLIIYQDLYSWPNLTIYVVVNIGGTLQWKKVAPRMVWTDSRTGQPWDPYYGQPGYDKR